MKVTKWLEEHFEEALLIILLILISCVELIQVIIRNIPWIPALTWAEEFCRFCWIWSVFLSLPYTIRKSSMLRVSVLLDVFPDKARKVINICVDLITAFCMLLLGIHSVSVISKIFQSGETSPAMTWPMWIIYSIMLIGFFGGFLRGIQQAVLHIRGFQTRSVRTVDRTREDAAQEVEAGRKAERTEPEECERNSEREENSGSSHVDHTDNIMPDGNTKGGNK